MLSQRMAHAVWDWTTYVSHQMNANWWKDGKAHTHARITSLIQLILLSQFRFFLLSSRHFSSIQSFAPSSPFWFWFSFSFLAQRHSFFLLVFRLSFAVFCVCTRFSSFSVLNSVVVRLDFAKSIYTDDMVFLLIGQRTHTPSFFVFFHSVGRFSFQFVHIIRLSRKRMCGFASVPLKMIFFHPVFRWIRAYRLQRNEN